MAVEGEEEEAGFSCQDCCLRLISSSLEGQQLALVELDTTAFPGQFEFTPGLMDHLPARQQILTAGGCFFAPRSQNLEHPVVEIYAGEGALHHNLGGEAKIHRFEGAVGEFGSKIGAQLLLPHVERLQHPHIERLQLPHVERLQHPNVERLQHPHVERLQHQRFPKTICVRLHQANCAPQPLKEPKNNPGDEEGGEDIVPHLCISFGQVGTGRAVQKALFVIFMGKIDGEGSGGDDDQQGGEEGDDPLEGDVVHDADTPLLLQPLVLLACTANKDKERDN